MNDEIDENNMSIGPPQGNNEDLSGHVDRVSPSAGANEQDAEPIDPEAQDPLTDGLAQTLPAAPETEAEETICQPDNEDLADHVDQESPSAGANNQNAEPIDLEAQDPLTDGLAQTPPAAPEVEVEETICQPDEALQPQPSSTYANEPATEIYEKHDEIDGEPQVPATDTQEQLERLCEAVIDLDDKVSLIPRQVRAMGVKIEGLSAAISEPRCHALLMDLVRIFDLVVQLGQEEAAIGDVPANRESLHRYDMLRKQVCQIMAANGLVEIPAEGAFDPEIHRAVLRVPCNDPDKDQRIKKVKRSGFRTVQGIFRYPDVEVWAYTGEAGANNADADEAAPPKSGEQGQVK